MMLTHRQRQPVIVPPTMNEIVNGIDILKFNIINYQILQNVLMGRIAYMIYGRISSDIVGRVLIRSTFMIISYRLLVMLSQFSLISD